MKDARAVKGREGQRLVDNIQTTERRDAGRIRQHTRVSYQGALRVYYSDAMECIDAITRDLSTGGLYVLSEERIPLGERVTVDLFIADQRCITVEGRVVRYGSKNEPPGFGVELDSASAEYRNIIVDEVISTLQELVDQPVIRLDAPDRVKNLLHTIRTATQE